MIRTRIPSVSNYIGYNINIGIKYIRIYIVFKEYDVGCR